MIALLSLVAVAAAEALATCDSCLVNNAAAIGGDASKTVHAWCYSKNQCMDVGVSLFQCPDFTFDYDTCLCRPDVYTTCETCATAAHLGCIW